MYGFRLKRWRYGSDYNQEFIEAEKREIFSSGQILDYQKFQLVNMLHSALENVEWYKKNVDIETLSITLENVFEALNQFPILEKEEIRKSPFSFINPRYKLSNLYEEHTSGTTGTPLRLFWSKVMVERWYALFHLRWLSWAGFSNTDRWAILGGQLVVNVKRKKPPYWVENWAMKQLYFSIYHISPNTIAAYLNKLGSYSPRYIMTYPSALTSIVTLAEEAGISWSGPQIGAVIGNAEPFLSWQREKIQNFFNTKTIDTYGGSEGVFMGAECENGKLHLSPDVGYWEVLDDNGTPVENGVAGHFICTGLLNEAMPLIRYRTGDILTIGKKKCPCGLNFPVIEQIVGRIDDLIILPDGRNIGRLDPILKIDCPVKEVQFVQTKLNRIVVKVVPAAGFGEETIQSLRQAIQERLGDQIEIDIQKVDLIPRTNAGKFKAVVSKINQ